MTPRLCWARSEGITLQNLRHFPYVGLARPLNDRLLRTLPFPLHEHAAQPPLMNSLRVRLGSQECLGPGPWFKGNGLRKRAG